MMMVLIKGKYSISNFLFFSIFLVEESIFQCLSFVIHPLFCFIIEIVLLIDNIVFLPMCMFVDRFTCCCYSCVDVMIVFLPHVLSHFSFCSALSRQTRTHICHMILHFFFLFLSLSLSHMIFSYSHIYSRFFFIDSNNNNNDDDDDDDSLVCIYFSLSSLV